jgi:hypothetical protein
VPSLKFAWELNAGHIFAGLGFAISVFGVAVHVETGLISSAQAIEALRVEVKNLHDLDPMKHAEFQQWQTAVAHDLSVLREDVAVLKDEELRRPTFQQKSR